MSKRNERAVQSLLERKRRIGLTPKEHAHAVRQLAAMRLDCIPPERRFAYKVYQRGDCWEWRGAIGSNGYGKVNYGGRYLKAHQVAFMLAKGPPPKKGSGFELDHICQHRWCVRPSHLVVVALRANRDRRADPGGWLKRRKNPSP